MDLESIWQGLTSRASGSLHGLGELGLMAVEAVIVIVIARFIAHRLRERTRRSPAMDKLGPNGAALLANGVAIGVYIITGSVILGILGASWTAVLAALSVGTVAISLSLQDILRNFVAGVYLLLEQPFSIGQKIQVRGVSGVVEGIGFRTTKLRNANQEQVLVPNATVFVEIITNRSAYHLEQSRIKLKGSHRRFRPLRRRSAPSCPDSAGTIHRCCAST